MSTATTWPVPEISDIEAAFPAHVLQWMPPMDEIPDEFKHWGPGGSEWNQIVSAWFFKGLNDKPEFVPNEGIDAKAAFRAIKAALGSYEPKHEHKEAAVAYLLSLWFKRVKNWKKP